MTKKFSITKYDLTYTSVVSLASGLLVYLFFILLDVNISTIIVAEINEKIFRCNKASQIFSSSIEGLTFEEVKSKLAHMRNAFAWNMREGSVGKDERLTYPVLVDRQGYDLEGKFNPIPNEHLKGMKTIFLDGNSLVLVFPIPGNEPKFYLLLPLKANIPLEIEFHNNTPTIKPIVSPLKLLKENYLLILIIILMTGIISLKARWYLSKKYKERVFLKYRINLAKVKSLREDLDNTKKSVYKLRSITDTVRKNLLRYVERYLDVYGNILELMGEFDLSHLNAETITKPPQIILYDLFSNQTHPLITLLTEALSIFEDEIEIKRISFQLDEHSKGKVTSDYDFIFSLLLKSIEGILKSAPIGDNIKILSSVKDGELTLCFSGKFNCSDKDYSYPKYITNQFSMKKDLTTHKLIIRELTELRKAKDQINGNIIPLFVK